MNRNLTPQLTLQRLATIIKQAVWSQGNRALTGTLKGRYVKGRVFASGTCISMTLAWPLQQASRACLLLAATTEARDDALYIEQEQLWLLRRYPVALTEVELDLLLQQQLTLAELLVPPAKNVLPSPPSFGRFA